MPASKPGLAINFDPHRVRQNDVEENKEKTVPIPGGTL
jgi:hypothetical protein